MTRWAALYQHAKLVVFTIMFNSRLSSVFAAVWLVFVFCLSPSYVSPVARQLGAVWTSHIVEPLKDVVLAGNIVDYRYPVDVILQGDYFI